MSKVQIQIKGMVQGVGFRPFVHKLATEFGINGTVSNGTKGVKILCEGAEDNIHRFCDKILVNHPPNAIITSLDIYPTVLEIKSGFKIVESSNGGFSSVLLTPDLAICPECTTQMQDETDHRFRYPFTTCLNCGPRYSITKAMPYDRQSTTMQLLDMCEVCCQEYSDLESNRLHSQTNSCPKCTIPMHFYAISGEELATQNEEILRLTKKEFEKGKILAVKGTGGYLLMCDATNETSIKTLRERKNRPSKPFAVLFEDLNAAEIEVNLSTEEKAELLSKEAPIVLCRIKKSVSKNLCVAEIAPGLSKIGVMLPNSPLLHLIAADFGRPLVSTSANVSGSPIIFRDEEVVSNLASIADFYISYDREILVPQDDSVVQFTKNKRRIILRRSRGFAPNYFPISFQMTDQAVLALGADLKSSFTLNKKELVFVSQYLGNLESLESEIAFDKTLNHIQKLVDFKPEVVLADLHPNYHSSLKAEAISNLLDIPLEKIQHHKAHFYSVLAENNLLNSLEPVLGVIWDGTGYGEDGQIWGGEFFVYQNQEIERVFHLKYFPQIGGDKMSKNPKLSALSLLHGLDDFKEILREDFTATEWSFYSKLLNQPTNLKTSSMGRFLDGIAYLLGINMPNTYEGEAALKLEALVSGENAGFNKSFYPFEISGEVIDFEPILMGLIYDKIDGKPISDIAEKLFKTLSVIIAEISAVLGIDNLAFSGGVFQNAVLNDKIFEDLASSKKLFFHHQLSPNDENISFGQFAYFSDIQEVNSLDKNIFEPSNQIKQCV